MISGNRGEWSEIYTLFKLLGDKELFLGSKEIEKLENFVYPIIRIIRSENNKEFQYSIEDELVIISGGENVLSIKLVEFRDKAQYLFDEITNKKTGTFTIPLVEEFMNSINCFSIKAKSSKKTDITIVIHDLRTNQQPTLGFSIKSQLGNPSTLLNAGKTTNFIYKINNLNLQHSEIHNINSIVTRSKIKDRVLKIESLGGSFSFVKPEKNVFSNNLVLIDSKLPDLLAEIVHSFYSSSNSNMVDLTNSINESNPLFYDKSDNHKFYEYKIKRFLTDVALGMMPSEVWTGHYDATGGYLVVKEDGDVLCYHVYNRNEFEDYIFNNTKLETASSTRHNFGILYEEDGDLLFKLNLQIRFIK